MVEGDKMSMINIVHFGGLCDLEGSMKFVTLTNSMEIRYAPIHVTLMSLCSYPDILLGEVL